MSIHENGFIIAKTISDCERWKIWNILCLEAFLICRQNRVARVRQLAQRLALVPRRSARVECRRVG